MTFITIWLGALAVIAGIATAVWLLSIPLKNVSIVDIFWGLLFVAAVWFYYFRTSGSGRAERRLLVTSLTTIWGLRLSIYLLWRNWGKPEDYRYQAFRRHFGAERYWWFSFFQVFLLQGVLAWLISAPLLGAQTVNRWSSGLNLLDGLALLVWLIGFAFEAGGDWQLARFKANPANRGKLLTTGFWRYTRHPNYFGDACAWWGFALFALAAGSIVPILGAALMTFLLLRVSGVALLERNLQKTKPEYADYTAKTNAFFPWWPKG